jgi:hypothetical protein
LPGFVGSAPHQNLMVASGKSGKIYLIDRGDMGGFTPGGPDRVVQIVTAGQPGVWGNPSFFQTGAASGIIYYHGSGGDLRGYRITNAHIDDNPANILDSHLVSGFPGTQPIVSANGIANPTSPTDGIVWELQVDNFAHGGIGLGGNPTSPAVLRAWNATNFGTELYDSAQTTPRDQLGNAVKFTTLAESNGHVFAGTQSTVEVFGLFPASTAVPDARTNLLGVRQATPSGTVINLTWTNPPPAAGTAPTGIRIFRSLDGSNFTLIATAAGADSSYTDTGPFTAGQTYTYRVVATNQRGDSPPSNTVNVQVPIDTPLLSLAGVSASSVGLAWTAVANDHYTVERSVGGGAFTVVATVPAFQTTYTDTGLTAGIYAYRIHAFNVTPTAESLSGVQGATVGPTIDHGAGFANPADLTANGSAAVSPTEGVLRLTGDNNQAGSAFANTRMAVSRFTTTFEIRLHEGTQPNYADGVAFVLQANAPTALGQGGAGLGYQGIGRSVAVKFGTFQYTGDPSSSSVGVFVNGAAPRGGVSTLPDVLLNSQDQKDVTLTYNGTTLNVTILDVPRGTSFTTSFPVDIAGALGSDTAYVGFTGSTGSPGAMSYWQLQDIVNWTFTSQTPLPGAPGNLRLTASTSNEVDLSWNANSFNDTSFKIERSTNGTTWSQIDTTTGTTYRDVGLVGGNYYYRVRASNAAGDSPYSATFQTAVPGPFLLQDQDVGTPGDPALPGSATFANGAWTVTGSGHDIWDQADGFHFVYKPLVGDGMIQARVVSMTNSDYWAKAGVMIRDTLSGNSRDAYVTMTPHNQVQFLDRAATGDNATEADPGTATGIAFPMWVRVVRQGNNFTGFWSPDGTTWNQLGGAVTINMGPVTYVGLVTSSHNNGVIVTSMFDNVSIVPAVLQTSHLDVSAAVPAVQPGTPVNVTVQALDQYNNPVPGYRSTVHFTSSDTTATLPADYTFTAADNGRHTFSVTWRTLGRQTVFATDTMSNVILGGTGVTVTNQAVLGSLVGSGFPSTIVAGLQGSFTITARDTQGNTFTAYRGTVHFTSSDPRAVLPADYTFTAADAGVHSFTFTLNTPGSQSITTTDTATQIHFTQPGIQVVAAPAITTLSRSAALLIVGGMLTVSGTFTDPVAQMHQAVIRWGDGTADTTLSLPAGTLTFSTSHPYTQAGNFQIQVTVTGANQGSDAVVLAATTAAVAPPSGLVGWWSGDGSNSTTAPDLAGGNPGTLLNGATHAPGEVGNAFSLNGVGWVSIPTTTNIPTGNPTYTLMAWINPTAAGNSGILGYGNYGTNNQTNAFRLLDDGTGHLNFRHYWWGNDLDAFTTIPANSGTWHLAVAEYDGTTRRILLDGNVIASDTPAPGHNVTAINLAVGATDILGGVPQEIFNGLIDEAQIYNRALTQAEIQAIFAAGSAGLIKGVRTQLIPPPVITTVSHTASVINEGGTFGVTTTFTDPVAGQTHTAVVIWGDGSANTTLSLPAGVLSFSASHPYAEEGNFQIQVMVTSPGGPSDAVVLTATAAAVAPPSGLVGWWSGDGSNPTTAPDLVGGNPGTLLNGATHAPGEVGNAFSLNGSNQYIDLPAATNVPVGNSPYTLMAWIRPNGAGNWGILGYGNYGTGNQVNAFRLVDNGTGHLNLLNYWWANDLEADTNVSATGAWHLAVAEFDGTTRRILLDGQVIGMDTPSGHNVPSAANFRIGSTNLGEYFNGLIDEAQVYNRALTQAEVQAIFAAGSAGQVKGVRVSDSAVVPTGGFTAIAYTRITSPQQTVAVFTDPGGYEAMGDYSASINWGDSPTPTNGTISLNTSTGVFTVQGSHLYTRAGNFTITVTLHHDAAPDVTATSSALVLNPTLRLTGFPSPTAAGTTGSFTLTAQDAVGSPLTGYFGTVHFTGTDRQAVLPADYTFTAADGGTHTFSATLETAGSQSITAVDTATAGVSGSQTGILVTPGQPTQVTVAGYPTAVSGAENTVTVSVTDAYGNNVAGYRGTMHFTSSDPLALLPDDYTFTAADAGSHTFGADLITVGPASVTATDTATAALTGTQSGITITPRYVTVEPAGVATAGSPVNVLVTAYDAYGNLATGYRGTMHLTSGDPQAVLPPDYTFTATDAGAHSFSVILKTAGFQSVTAADTLTPGRSNGTGYVEVDPAAAVRLTVAGYPSPSVAGTGGVLVVTAYDAYGNVATGYTGTVHLTSTDPQAYLGPDYTFTPDDAGQAAFYAVLVTAGSQSITATDASGPTGSQSGIVVTPADAAYFAVTALPGSVTAGQPAGFTVTAYDLWSNVATGYRGTVGFTSSDLQAVLPANYAFTAADAGTHSFSVTLKTAGFQSVVVTDTAQPGVSGEGDTLVIAAAAVPLVVSGYPSPVAVGSQNSFTVTAYDIYGNVATGYRGTIHFSSNDSQALVEQDYQFSEADQGQHTFNAIFLTAGTWWLDAIDVMTVSLHGRQDGIVVQ